MTDFRTSEEYPYFIYRHIRLDNGKPFYIGRGKYKIEGKSNKLFYQRAYSEKGRTTLWKRVVNKHGYDVEIISDNLTIEEAKQKETEFIALHKRAQEGGTLVNFKNGGEETNTTYRHSQETIQKFRKTQLKDVNHNINKYVVFEPMTGCWLWTGTFIENHPKINIYGRTLHTRRFLYEQEFNLKLRQKADVVENTCGCDYCVNPLHSMLVKPMYGIAVNK